MLFQGQLWDRGVDWSGEPARATGRMDIVPFGRAKCLFWRGFCRSPRFRALPTRWPGTGFVFAALSSNIGWRAI